jgi:hypothetical protein
MKTALKMTTLAVGAVLAVTAGQTAAAAAACKTRLSAADQVVALNAISNLMGRYSHLGHLRGEDTLEELFAMKTPDVSWRSPSGPQGIEGMKARFRQPGEAPRGEVPGQLHVHSMLTPVIEVAADGKTAKGVWDSFGPNISNGNDIGNWLWVKYGVDFIKEDGAWKIWHMQVYALFNTPYDKSITQSAWERANPGFNARPGAGTGAARQGGPAPAGAAPAGAAPRAGGAPAAGGQGANGPAMGGPGQGWSAPKDMWIYDGKSAARGPYIPEPYCSFDPALSYGKI